MTSEQQIQELLKRVSNLESALSGLLDLMQKEIVPKISSLDARSKNRY